MNQFYTEYDATASSPRPCYSNLNNYGTDGKVHQIIPPIPATLQPLMFNIVKPHPIKNQSIQSIKRHNCLPYHTLSQLSQ